MNHEDLRGWLCERVAGLAGILAADVDEEVEFHAYGIDSAHAAELVGELEQRLGRRIDVGTLYANPRICSLVEALAAPPTNAIAETENGGPRPADDEAIAIVGAACRFPGARDLTSFWQLLVDGRCAVGEVPAQRWDSACWSSDDPGRPGRSVSARGGFIDEIDGLDQNFFGIPAAEAARMDPQQRIMLEVAWDALEDAGAPPRSVRGSNTGVYVAVSLGEYGSWQLRDPLSIDAFVATGGALSVVANRLSYLLDLRGPSMAVDTACSSSLVAVHLARRALLARECDVAIAGGVNAVLAPEIGVSMSKTGVLSSDGLCKAFDASANGYVRSEGGGAVVLKRLSDALAHHDRILAVLSGSAVNQDGRSNGLTAPNPAAQTAVIRAALRDARVRPEDVGYVEAHGSATALGDRMEAAALGASVRPNGGGDDPCWIGSVKSNLGHLESAAGMAGLLKVVLSVHHGVVPASLHVQEPNPAIDFAGLRLEVVRDLRAWEQRASRRIAGASSFGFGGTNAHVVVRGHDAASAPAAADADVLLTLSAHDGAALRETALRWADWIDTTTPTVEDVVTTADARTRHAHRIAVVGSRASELSEQLRSAVERIDDGDAPRARQRIGFVFSGQGPSWKGNAADLYARDALFASIIRRVEEEGQTLGRPAGWLVNPICGHAQEPVTDQAWMQPAWFAVQVALAAVLRSAGVQPSVILGHSLGEVAAAHVAGSLDLASAARVACIRGTVAAELMDGRGGLVATDLAEGEAKEEVACCGGSLALAAFNSPSSTVFAGDQQALGALLERLQSRGRFARRLELAPPSHSHLASTAAERLGALLSELPARAPRIRTFSSVTGEPFDSASTDGAYWRDNLRQPVCFSRAAAAMLGEVDAIVELGPQPAVARSLREIVGAARRESPLIVTASDREGPTRKALLAAVAQLIEGGVDVKQARLRPVTGQRLCAPGTAWQRRRAWSDPRERTSGNASEHDLLGGELSVASLSDHSIWQTQLREELGSIHDHRVSGEIVVPAAAFIDAFLVAGRRAGLGTTLELASLRLERFLRVGHPSPEVQSSVRRSPDGGAAVELHSRVGKGSWQRHVRGELRASAPLAGPAWQELAAAAPEEVNVDRLYRGFSDLGVDYGPAYRALESVQRGVGVAVATLRGGEGTATDPALLDGAFQLVAAALGLGRDDAVLDGMMFPVAVRSVRSNGAGVPVRAAARITRDSRPQIEADVWLYGADGAVTVAVEGLVLRTSSVVGSEGDSAAQRVWSYDVTWRRSPRLSAPTCAEPRRWIVLGEAGGPAARLACELAAREETLAACSGRYRVDGHVEVAGERARALDALLAEHGDQPWGVVVIAGDGGDGSAGDPGQRAGDLARDALRVIRSLSFAPLSTPPRLVFVSDGAVQVRRGTNGVEDPTGGVLRGLCRVVPFENPLLDCRLIDCDDLGSLTELADEIVHGDDADVALSDGERYVARLVPVDSSFVDAATLDLDPAGAYVITGGAGGIGLALAGHLVDRGARQVALLVRSEPSQDALHLIADLRATGARVLVLCADVGDSRQLAGALQQVREELGPLRGVVHAAGTLIDRAMLDLKEDELVAVLRPKVAGGWNLHCAVAGDDLDWFVLFSSAAGVVGSPGQAAYCAANAFLDTLAAHRRSRSAVATSIDWGPWARIGAVSDRVGDSERAGAATRAGLDPTTAFAAFDALLVEQPRQRVLLPYDMSDLISYHPGGTSLAFFAEIVKDRADLASMAGVRRAPRRRPRLDHDPVAPRTNVEHRILKLWQSALGIEEIGTSDGFFDLGGDSVLAHQVFMSVNREFGVSLDIESAFADATVASLAVMVEGAMTEGAR